MDQRILLLISLFYILINLTNCVMDDLEQLPLEQEIELSLKNDSAYYRINIVNQEHTYLIIQTVSSYGDRYPMSISSSLDEIDDNPDFVSFQQLRGTEVIVVPKSYYKKSKNLYLHIYSKCILRFNLYATFTHKRILNYFNWQFNREYDNILYSNDYMGEFNKHISKMDYLYRISTELINSKGHIIIGIEHEYFVNFNIEYFIGDNSLYSSVVFLPRKFIIYPKDIETHCKNVNGECYLTIVISTTDDVIQKYTKLLYSINIKSEEPFPVLLPDNKPKRDLNIGKSISYFYFLKSTQYSVEVILNNNKGSGRMFAFSIRESEIDQLKNWSDIINSKDKKYHEFDINTGRILIGKIQSYMYFEVVVVGVISNDNSEGDSNDDETIYEYSLVYHKYFDYTKSSVSQFGMIEMLSNELVNGVLEQNTNKNLGLIDIGKRNMILFQYTIPKGIAQLDYEILYCDSCVVSTLHFNKFKDIKEDNILSFATYEYMYTSTASTLLISGNHHVSSESFEGTVLLIGVSCKEIEETNFTKFALGLYPIYENTRTQFHLLTSENYFHCNTLSNRFCYYLIPTYGYEQTEELIISISTSDDTPVTSAFIEVFIYNYEHGDFFINTKSTKKWKTMISQIKGNTNNYLSIGASYFNQKNSFIYVSFSEASRNIFDVHATFIKKCHKSLLNTNKKALMYVDKKHPKILTLPYIDSTVPSMENNIAGSEVVIKHLKGNGVIHIGNNPKHKCIPIDKGHSTITMIYKTLYTKNNDIHINTDSGLYFYVLFLTKPKEHLSLISSSKIHHFIYPFNTFPVMTYINNPSEEADTTFNILIKGLQNRELTSNYNWSLKGFLLNNDFINKRKGNEQLHPEFHKMVNGHYDSVSFRGTVLFKANDIQQYSTKYNKTLLIRYYDKNKQTIPEHLGNKNALVKVSAIKSNEFETPLPQYDYFYSQIQSPSNVHDASYNVYKLETIEHSNQYMYIEYSSCYGDSNFALKYTYVSSSDAKYSNDTDLEIINESTNYGKRSLLIKLKNNYKTLYIIIFPNTEKHSFPDTDPIHFVIKYYSFDKYYNYLYEMSPILNDTSLQYNKDEDNQIHLSWEAISDKMNEYGYGVHYHVRVYERNQFKYNNEIFSICLYNHPLLHSATSSTPSLTVDKLPKGEIYIHVVAHIPKENNFEEIIIAYTPISLVNGKVVHITTNTNDNSTRSRSKASSYFYISIGLVIIILILILLLLYMYKMIRQFQLNHMYQLIETRKQKGKINKHKPKVNAPPVVGSIPKNLSCIIEQDNNTSNNV